MTRHAPRAVLTGLAALLVAYLLVPLAGFGMRLTGTRGVPPGAGLAAALGTSLASATIATGLIGVCGIPLGYLLAHRRGRLATAVGVVVQLPLALPPLMSGILLVYVVGPYTVLGRLTGGRLTDSLAGVVLAQTFVAAPFLVVAARSAFAGLDPALTDVAATLGHGPWSRFVRVALPAAGHGIRAGLLLAWLRAFGEFGATVILAYHPYTLPVLTYVRFGGTGLPSTLLPVGVTLVAALAVLLAADRLPRLRRRRRDTRLPDPVAPAARSGPAPRFDVATRVGGFRLRVDHPATGRTLAVLGPSGAGKSILLRILAGLVPATGDVCLVGDAGQVDLSDTPAERRRIGYLPQDPALLPGLSAWRQVTFGVDADPGVAAYWMHRLGLAGLADRRPDELSGGQRRRVALVRALARQPQLVLLDEPSTGLDAPVRDELRSHLRRLQRDTAIATVLVTHDPDEAAMLADDVLLLSGGHVLQQGRRTDVYRHPAGPAAARLLGYRNVADARLDPDGRLSVAGVALCDTDLPPGTPVGWCVPPDRVGLDGAGRGPRAEVVDVVELTHVTHVLLALPDGTRLTASTTGPPPTGSCTLRISPATVTVWAHPTAAADVGRAHVRRPV